MSHHKQRGITLILSLVMLVLLTMIALTTLNIGKGDLQLVDNAQQRAIALNAAQAVVDQIISSPSFVDSPTTVLDNSNCPAALSAPANSRCTDVYGDGRTVVLVTLSPAPACIQVTPVAADAPGGCSFGVVQGSFGVEGGSSSAGGCYESLWEITAVATEAKSGARAVVTQGVKMQVSADAIAASCP